MSNSSADFILGIIEDIQDTSSRLGKERILDDNRNNDALKTLFWNAYNPLINFYMKKIPDYTSVSSPIDMQINLTTIFDEMLPKLSKREVTGHAARDYVICCLEKADVALQELIKMILQKDLRCGVSSKTINKIWPGLIPETKMMLASTDVSQIEFPCFIQEKMDGVRCNLIKLTTDQYSLITRNGKTIHDGGVFKSIANMILNDGETLDGELLFYNIKTNEPLSRKVSNGLVNKMIKETITDEELKGVRFVAWDLISDKTKSLSYTTRFDNLSQTIKKDKSDRLILCKSSIIDTMENAQEIFKNYLAEGKEGCILKNMNSPWEGKRSKNMAKLKDIREADLRCVGWEEGTGKNVGLLGALIFETDDGQLQVYCGTGFSDKQRKEFTLENTKGKIGTLEYNAVINSKSGKKKSLFLPRFVDWRFDKNTTNTLKELES